MKLFHCGHCHQLVYFENSQCVNCGNTLAFVPDLLEVTSLEPEEGEIWRSPKNHARRYRLCDNYTGNQVCNWAVEVSDPAPYCRACRLNRIVPDLSAPGNLLAWKTLELAKRRLVYSLLQLGLPVQSRDENPTSGLAFEFLSDESSKPVLTGHNEGVITINVAEADDAERERRRVQLGEPYRTVLGHFRHEVGHYYWDLLIRDGGRLAVFREHFGNEEVSYDDALKAYYKNGPAPNWQERFVTAYATAHPWEDWAETWAHYLHMSDTIETAAECGLSIRPETDGDPTVLRMEYSNFQEMMACWFPLTHVLNTLNRGLGLPDGYPFVLSPPAVAKLEFVHLTITGQPAAAL